MSRDVIMRTPMARGLAARSPGSRRCFGQRGPGKDRQGRIDGQGNQVPIDNEGHTVVGWTYNGQVPGPLFRATEGDTIEFTLKNDPSQQEFALDRLSCGAHRRADRVRADQAGRDQELHIHVPTTPGSFSITAAPIR